MRRVLATLVVLSLVMSMFTGIFAPVPGARAAGPAAVNLGSAGNFVILAKTGISTTGTTHVTGDIGVSPAAASFITGFALAAPPTTFTTSLLVTGKVYAADYDPPTPTYLTTAVGDMQTAYTAAAGVTAPAPVVELGAGNIGGLTIAPGVYKWGTGVTIPTDVTLSGGANDVWIFQIAQTLTLSNGIHVKLSGGAKAANVFWQVAGQTTLGTTSVFNGIILDQTAIVLNTGATLNGRAFAQTAVTLDANAVSAPASAGALTLTTTASPFAGGSIGRSPNAAAYASGSVVTLTATPAAGYAFAGWSGDLTGNMNPTTITMTGNKHVTAMFAAALMLSSSWNLISVPVPLPVSSISGLQSVFGYHNAWTVPTTLLPGEAYWVRVQHAVAVPLIGTPATTPVSLTYQAGWQLLGNPFRVPVLISSIINHHLITVCYSYDPLSGWGVVNLITGVLQPGKGYWIQLSAPTTLTFMHP